MDPGIILIGQKKAISYLKIFLSQSLQSLSCNHQLIFLLRIEPFCFRSGRSHLLFPEGLVTPQQASVYGVIIFCTLNISGIRLYPYAPCKRIFLQTFFLLFRKSVHKGNIIFCPVQSGILLPTEIQIGDPQGEYAKQHKSRQTNGKK